MIQRARIGMVSAMTHLRWLVFPLTFALGGLVLACGAAAPAKTIEPKFQEVAAIHHSRCGGCHRRVEPGERSRDTFTSAMTRHHDRVKNLSDAQWTLLVDYLSDDAKASPAAQ